jgi:predicted phosphodiesterase
MIAPVVAVRGNGDWWVEEFRSQDYSNGESENRITHGYLGKGNNTPERAYNTFAADQVDMIVFGHSHIPYKGYKNGILNV